METHSDLYSGILEELSVSIKDLEVKLKRSEDELHHMYETYDRLCRGYSLMLWSTKRNHSRDTTRGMEK